MDIEGRRIHIAGSASPNANPKLLGYGHNLLSQITKALIKKGAMFLVQVGREPRMKDYDLPIIFDWTVISTIYDCLNTGEAKPSTWKGPILATIITSRTDIQIPQDRREIWDQLLALNAVQLDCLEPGWSSGAVRRTRMADLGDILIILSGGEGVEHLANEYSFREKPVLPLDLDLGSSSSDGAGGATRLASEMKAHPNRFFRLLEPRAAGSLITKMGTQAGNVTESKITQAIVDFMESLEPPNAFYIRLLDRESEEFPAVERFFRNVVDPVVKEAGYKIIEMGLSPPKKAWLNVEIFNSLHNSGLVVVDLTGLRPNCLIELGYALGRSRRTIITAQRNTHLPFDSSMLECYFWDDAKSNDTKITEFKEYWFRNINRPPIVENRGIL